MKNRIKYPLALAILIAIPAFGDEVADLESRLSVIRARITIEQVRYQEAKAKIERSELVAKYLLPELQARKKALQDKIKKLRAEEEKQQESK